MERQYGNRKSPLWKGAITFGLLHIPVGLHTAATEQGVDFDWLDKRSMDPVGYKRINKKTGKEIDKDNIVKGVEYEDGKYLIISPEGTKLLACFVIAPTKLLMRQAGAFRV